MRVLTFGAAGAKTMLLIHGAQTPWQVWTPQIEHFSKEYYVLVPILPGHNTEHPSTFFSVEKTAEEIENYCTETVGKDIDVVAGLSMGGSIASLLWSNARLHINHLILDGAPLVPQNKLLSNLLAKNYIQLTSKVQQREKKTLEMAEQQFMPQPYLPAFLALMDGMTDDTILNFTASIGEYQLSKNCSSTTTQVLYCYGSSLNELLSKHSAKRLKHYYPKAVTHCFKGYSHSELSIFRPAEFIKNTELFVRGEPLG